MAGFFEKRVMADIEKRVNSLWPDLDVSVVPSDYNSDGLCLRVRVDEDLYVDSTIFNGRWTAMIGADGDHLSMAPDPRLFQVYALSVGAPSSQVAPAIVNYLRDAWGGFAAFKAAIIAMGEG